MFQNLRNFSIISILIITLLALGIGSVFKRMIADDLFTLVEKNNASLAQSFANSVWRPHQSTITSLQSSESHEWLKNDDYIQMTKQAFKFFEDMPVVKVNIYLSDGTLLFSSDRSKILYQAEQTRDASTLFSTNKVLQGETVAEVLHDSGFFTPSGKQREGVLVHTITPIANDAVSPIMASTAKNIVGTAYSGMVEIFYDSTDAWNAIGWFQWTSTIGIIMLFILLLAALIFISRRSEAIIAKQHELNLELTATAAAAEAESRDKAQFLANISHELRTPLNAIIGFSQILEAELNTTISDTHNTYIRDIHSSGSHLLSLINDILDYSKAEAGKLELSLRETNLTKLIKNNMRVVFPRAEEAQITLAEDLPIEHIVINTDSKKLKQSLLNLLSNSVKFTPAGGEVRVSMWENIMDNTISIEVSDTGIGIEQKNISKVLSPFGQVENNLDRKYEGTGLGLPLAKKFVEVMGGTFKIESEVGKGTAITLTFPAEKVDAADAQNSDNSEQEPTAAQPAPAEAPSEQAAQQEAAPDAPKEIII